MSGRPSPGRGAACCGRTGTGACSKGVAPGESTPPEPPLAVEDPRLVAWLVEASLYARATDLAPLKGLLDSPGLFPFRIKPVHADGLGAVSSRLDFLRQGLNDDLVMRRKQKTPSSP